jgi:hypothetical protein
MVKGRSGLAPVPRPSRAAIAAPPCPYVCSILRRSRMPVGLATTLIDAFADNEAIMPTPLASTVIFGERCIWRCPRLVEGLPLLALECTTSSCRSCWTKKVRRSRYSVVNASGRWVRPVAGRAQHRNERDCAQPTSMKVLHFPPAAAQKRCVVIQQPLWIELQIAYHGAQQAVGLELAGAWLPWLHRPI